MCLIVWTEMMYVLWWLLHLTDSQQSTPASHIKVWRSKQKEWEAADAAANVSWLSPQASARRGTEQVWAPSTSRCGGRAVHVWCNSSSCCAVLCCYYGGANLVLWSVLASLV